MSIITEALKKAEQDRKQRKIEIDKTIAQAEEALKESTQVIEGEIPADELETSHSVLPLPVAESVAPAPAFQINWLQFKDIAILGVIVSICLFVLVGLFNWPKSQSNLPSFSAGLPQTAGLKKASPSVKLPFVLTGISVQGTDRYGIVNGLVVQPGDSVDGAIVKAITERDVVLESRAGEIKLRLPE